MYLVAQLRLVATLEADLAAVASPNSPPLPPPGPSDPEAWAATVAQHKAEDDVDERASWFRENERHKVAHRLWMQRLVSLLRRVAQET